MSHLAHCLTVLRHAVAPRRALSVSQWADDHRIVSGKQSAERGRWVTDRNPELREIMDCFSMNSRVRDVTVMKSSQRGVSEAVVNTLGYVMDHAPAPAMVLMPTLESRDSWKVQKLNPLLSETPAIRDLLGGVRARDAANRQDLIDFPGGVLFLAGGNSANSYAQKSVALIILDDLDRFPAEIGEEGDVITLAEGRTKAFPRGRRGYISTPTVEGGLIHTQWLASDQREWYMPCPHCDEYQVLEWGGPDVPHGMKWRTLPTGAVSDVRYVCRHCGAEIGEHMKPRMIARGRWIAKHPERITHRGYHMTALTAPIGLGPGWAELVASWRAAQADTGKLRAWINTNLGQPWKEQGEETDPNLLMNRMERYPDPLPPVVSSVGIDVQKGRIEVSQYGFAAGEETWAQRHLIIEGDTMGDEVWDDLGDALDALSPDTGAIDSGYATDQVLAFAKSRPWLFVIKGIEGRGKPLVEDDLARRQRLRKRRKKGFSPFLVSDEAAKALLAQRLKLERGNDGHAWPGYIHFPAGVADFDDEFFAQLTSNRLEEKKLRGKRTFEWKQTRVRNEAYDCWKYAQAGYRLSKLDPARARAQAAGEAGAETPPARPRKKRSFLRQW